MSQREKIIAVILGAVTLYGIVSSGVLAPRDDRGRGVQTGGALQPQAVPPILEKDALLMIEMFGAETQPSDFSNIQDPFRKFDLKAVVDKGDMDYSDLALTGIMMEPEPVALINGHILRAGERIGEFEIKEIRRNEVILIKGDAKYVLKLFLEL
ncbi:MAG: hypothetical protein Q8Q08_03805 [Candidatus Omnitrophota bacterium]|nr:hypothetical protein [Candidatus Omnitrophota bacterium]MDZ4241933.1 hypothetical protein [Candidatus Omnitrophota bacterium]